MVLELKNIDKSFGETKVLKGVSFTAEGGKAFGLLGRNGAGKTTTLRAISGLIKPAGGSVVLDGKNIAGLPTYKIAKNGVTQSPEGRHLFAELTVEENLKAGAYGLKTKIVNGVKVTAKEQLKANFERVYNLFPILKERAHQTANTLSGGEQQMVAIGRALMSDPKILLLDEPSLGLAPLIIEEIFEAFVKIRDEGTTILIVEQNALQTLKIADYGYVLELGKIGLEGPANELITNKKLIDAYLGG